MMRRLWMIGLGVMISGPVDAASFNCRLSNLAPDERAICKTLDLNDMDVEMAVTYRLLSGLFMMGTRHNMQDEQREWLQSRQRCGGDVECLRASYKARLRALQQYYDDIDRPI